MKNTVMHFCLLAACIGLDSHLYALPCHSSPMQEHIAFVMGDDDDKKPKQVGTADKKDKKPKADKKTAKDKDAKKTKKKASFADKLKSGLGLPEKKDKKNKTEKEDKEESKDAKRKDVKRTEEDIKRDERKARLEAIAARQKHRADSLERIAAAAREAERIRLSIPRMNDTVDVQRALQSPYLSLQQMLKGNVPGVYVRESTGEPGVNQPFFVRGISSPILSNKDISGNQPVVFVNGIPLLTGNSYLYNIKNTDVNPIGTNTNLLSGWNLNTIESLEVVKDPVRLAELGPLAANGAIVVKMKDSYRIGDKHLTVRASGGMQIATEDVRMTNAANEYNFRMKFADQTRTPEQRNAYMAKMPQWLTDVRDVNFYGTPGWSEEYYKKMAPLYNVGLTLGAGDKSANYIFMFGYNGTDGLIENTGFGKLNASFALNMMPIKGLWINLFVNGGRIDRTKNYNLRDRYAEMDYLPDLTTPLGPTKIEYNSYLNEFDEFGKDDNMTNILNGYLGLKYDYKAVTALTQLQLDYNTDVARWFYPSTWMDGASFVSNYSGYNRRLRWTSEIGYHHTLRTIHTLGLKIGSVIQMDAQHYNYTRAYDGTDDTKSTTKSGGFKYISRFVDKMENNLINLSATLKYSFKNQLDAMVVIRYDGTSNMMGDVRWLFSPGLGVNWNIKDMFLKESSFFSALNLRASWTRLGRFLEENRFGAGPQYTGDELTWSKQPIVSSYYGYASIARPYNSGWIGYGIGWPYSEKFDTELSVGLFHNRVRLSVAYYNNTDRDMITTVPVAQEMGYRYEYKNGMDVRNSGIEVGLAGSIFSNPTGFNWDASFSLAHNRNELLALPDDWSEMKIGDRKLKVGHSIDELWVYRNEGVYQSDEEVPVVDGKKLSMNGIAFGKGDPHWADTNGDNVITEDDKVMKGHILPQLTGSFSNTFRYKRFDLGFDLYFATGQDALNYRSSQRYDFLTLESRPSLESVREIFFWQTPNGKDSYPLYNQMSGLRPYRADQDIFLENADFLKLRSLTLGYTIPLKEIKQRRTEAEEAAMEAGNKKLRGKKKRVKQGKDSYGIENIRLYITGNNIFTLNDSFGYDPELVDINGMYRGYGCKLAPSITFGVNFTF